MDQKKILISLLLVVSSILHFAGLTHPDSVVFDEVHFGSYVSAYCCNGEYFFDIHPPHAKLLIAGTAKLFAYEANETFKHIGEAYEPGSAFALRVAPAITGILIPVAVFILLGQLGASLAACFLGGLLFVFDNALVLQTSIIALDGFLFLFTITSLSAFLFAMRQADMKRRLGAFALAGCLTSLALAAKFTGLVALGLVGFIALVDLAENPRTDNIKRWLQAALAFFITGALVYMGGWWLHFELLTEPGPGDIWGKLSGNFFTDFLVLHQKMLSANSGLSATHPDASPWWSWPIMLTPVFYWSKDSSWIYMVGNPMVWWVMSALMVLAASTYILSKISDLSFGDPKELQERQLWIPLVGYFAAYMPMVAVPRVLFLYHYYTPLMFSTLFVVLWLDSIGAIRPGDVLKQRWSYYAFIVVVIVGFAVISPITYGIFGDSEVKAAIFKVFPGWR